MNDTIKNKETSPQQVKIKCLIIIIKIKLIKYTHIILY